MTIASLPAVPVTVRVAVAGLKLNVAGTQRSSRASQCKATGRRGRRARNEYIGWSPEFGVSGCLTGHQPVRPGCGAEAVRPLGGSDGRWLLVVILLGLSPYSGMQIRAAGRTKNRRN